ncbi:MAG: aconitate hydratase [Candidatus Odinarchaeum yellowstonii]|uniref:Aconitate hydratase n=1 Tax=Odinarchaeota yellowstonii (strain LCB_4) TaxID=1841599 RepID=A0AAF0IBF3_ODILC|nr:MAG: aconitate hydratase [Candidatus Odinarchaeum yellowstonii]
MPLNLTYKILKDHLAEGNLVKGEEIGIRIDRTLTQDATGTLTYLQFEALGLDKVKTELSVSYVDHNTLQTDYMNADDHKYLQTVAAKYGVYFSKPGNGICHQVNLERFSKPGKTLLGSDSHTPTCGGVGMLGIGAGGLDVAVAMGGGLFYLNTPAILGVQLVGERKPWVSAKDVILEVLRRLTVKGGVGKIIEYYGEGVKNLDVYERATIANMGAETGATSSIFPSDEITREFFKLQRRPGDWVKLEADEGCEYDEYMTLNLDELEPLIALPHSPGNVKKVSEVEGTPVDQVTIGSCTNSSLKDLMIVAAILKDKTINPDVSLTISPGSKQVLEEIARNGALADLIAAGARILEAACGPCIGMGQAPRSGGISLRTFNRNFKGRSGTEDAQVYLASPEVAAAAALYGQITDPRRLGEYPIIKLPKRIRVNDNLIVKPPADPSKIQVIRGPNIKPIPVNTPLPEQISMEILIKLGDNITTDDILPAGVKILPLRSNIPAISEYVFKNIDPTFIDRVKKKKGGLILAGENYGQGSSREHAAIAPMYLGVKAVIAKSYARIHKSNLVNFGILPLQLTDPSDYNKIDQGDLITIKNIREQLAKGAQILDAVNTSKKHIFKVKHELTPRQAKIILAGGLLNYVRELNKKESE